jgi:hypothetical protein
MLPAMLSEMLPGRGWHLLAGDPAATLPGGTIRQYDVAYSLLNSNGEAYFVIRWDEPPNYGPPPQ